MRSGKVVVGVVVTAVLLSVLRRMWSARTADQADTAAPPVRKKATPAQLALLPLGLAAIGTIWFLLVKAFFSLHWFPDAPGPFLRFRTEAGGFLIVLPALFAAVGPGFLVTNFVARLVRPWGRVLDREAQGVPGGDFDSSQRGLALWSVVVFAIVLPLMVAGVLVGR
jgi:hypothetical protein